MGPFALVNGTFVNAASTEELYNKIKKQLLEDEESLKKDFPF